MKEDKSKQQGKNQNQAAKATKGEQNAKQGKKDQAKGQNQATKQNVSGKGKNKNKNKNKKQLKNGKVN